jgi:multidrug efflux pump
MMCAYLLKNMQHAPSHSRWSLDWVIQQYGKGLEWVFKHQAFTLAVMLSTVILAGVMYWMIPKGFFPIQDSGVIQVVTEAPDDISFQAMSERQQALAQQILKDPAVESLSSFIGIDANNPKLSNGRILINLKPYAERDSASQVMTRLQGEFDQVKGIQGWMQPVQELSIEDKISRTQYQLSLTATHSADLEQWTPILVDALRKQAEFADVTSDGGGLGLQAFIDVNRDAAARLDLSIEDISLALQNLFAQRQIATLYTQSNQYRIVLELAPESTQGFDALAQTYIHNSNGEPILLSSVATIVQKRVPILLQQQSQFPTNGVSFNLAEGVALGDAIKVIHRVEQQLNLPMDVKVKLQGAAAAYENSKQHTFWLVIAAIVTMYIVLGILYESFIHPITILSTLPSAAIGAVLALFMVNRPLDMIALIGIILLIGLVKKNGIMMVDFALAAQRNDGLSPQQAIYQAALMRFRPILMTTLAALVGAIPLMLASGAGAELRQPLGIVMVGGLLLSQILTLFTTPVVYLFFDRLQQSFSQSDLNQFDVDTAVTDNAGRES